jgi:hypothetical protein
MTDDPRTYDNLKGDETPNGVCGICGMVKMTINNQKKCPNCSTKTKGECNIVNNADDPGHDGFKELLSTPIKEPRYNDLKKLDGNIVEFKRVSPPVEIAESNYQAHLDCLYKFLGTISVDSIPRFKALLKLKKKVLNLQSEIKLFLDSK